MKRDPLNYDPTDPVCSVVGRPLTDQKVGVQSSAESNQNTIKDGSYGSLLWRSISKGEHLDWFVGVRIK